MLLQYILICILVRSNYRYDPLTEIEIEWRNKLENRMRFKGYLKKDGYLIRVSSNAAGAYQIEYSNDNLKTKEVKVYKSRYEFLKAMETRFSPEELKELLS